MSGSRSPGTAPCVDIPEPGPRRRRLATIAVIILVVGLEVPQLRDVRPHMHTALLASTAALGVEFVRELAASTTHRLTTWVRDRLAVVVIAVSRPAPLIQE